MKNFRKLLTALLLACTCFCLGACGGGSGVSSVLKPDPVDPPAPPAAPKAVVTGYVAYGETAVSAAPAAAAAGDLVANAVVELRKKSDYDAVLQKVYTVNGKFVLTDLAPADYIITAAVSDGGVTLKNEVALAVESGKYDYNLGSAPIELVRTANLAVTVKDQAGAAVSDALVTLDGFRNARTGADGTVAFNEITRGAHEIKATKSGYAECSDVVFAAGAAQTATAVMVASDAALTQPAVTGLYFGTDGESEPAATEGESLEISVNSNNPNGGTLSFTWSCEAGAFSNQNEGALPGGTTVSRVLWNAPAIAWADGQVYAYRGVSVSVTDSKGFVINRAGRIKVIRKGAARFTIISAPASLLVQPNQLFSYQMALSAAGDYKFEKLDGPAGMTVSATGLVTFTPAAYGDFNAVIRVTEKTGGYFQTQKFTLTAASSIAELSPGAGFSKTVLKPAGGLSTIIKNLKTTEHIVTIGYNKSQASSSFNLSAFNLNAAAGTALTAPGAAGFNAAAGADALAAAEREWLAPETAAAIRMDMARRACESAAARLRGDYAAAGTARAASHTGSGAATAAVGDIKDFYSLNSLAWPPRESDWTRVSAKLRAIGEHCYIYEDTSIPYPYLALSDAEAARIKNSFDSEVYPKITATFGSEPNPGIDGDPKVFILFTQCVNRQSAAGYFDSTNQLTQAKLDSSPDYNKNASGYKYYSNEKEIFYMAVPKTTLKGDAYINNTLGVLAHEFQHMINWNHHSLKNPDALEESWLNEGLSQLAQDEAGYGYQYGTLSFVIEPFLRYPESYSLTKFQFGLGYYGNAYLFVRYLADRGALPANLVKSSKTGKANVEDEVKRLGLAASFDDFFEDFAAALYLSNGGVTDDPRYNFKSINIRAVQKDGTKLTGLKPAGTVYLPTSYRSLTINEYGITAIKCPTQNAADFKFNLTDQGSGGGIGAVILRINGR